MGFAEVLTIIFVLLKVFGFVNWSWWIVFLPEIISLVFYVVWFGIIRRIFHKTSKSIKRSFDDDFFKF